ncbi:hypothetical protein ABTK14_23780, partial [Acinetobacter baumannii]
METHLGWAAKSLGLQLGKMLDANKELVDVRDFLTRIYSYQTLKPIDFQKMPEKEVRAAAEFLREGIPMATPV